MSFTTSVDIANRGLQHCGVPRIVAFTDSSRQAAETNFCYDMLRLAELRRSVWRFATRRAILRPLTATTKRIVPPVYASGTSYSAGQLVRDSAGIYWICLIAGAGNTPGVDTAGQPPNWTQYFGPLTADAFDATVTYAAGEIVISGGNLYLSLVNANINHVPPHANWIVLTGATQSAIFIPQPVGVNYTVGTPAVVRNLFRLPNGYLRLAAPDGKRAGTSNLQTSGAIRHVDWQFEGDWIVSASTVAIPLRFVADVSYVPVFDPLFCEGLGARIGYEAAPTLTQSTAKQQAIGAAYTKFMREARMVNSIETGDTESDEDGLMSGGTAQSVSGGSGPAPQQQGAG